MEILEEICRLCLENSQEMHQIFEECLNNKIVILTGVELLANDSLPKQICYNCRHQLETSYYFRLLAKQNNTKLRKFTRLAKIEGKINNHILSKDYKDDDIEELDEQILESTKYFDKCRRQIENEKQMAIESALEKLPKSLKSAGKSTKPVIVLNKCPSTSSTAKNVRTTVRRKEVIPVEFEDEAEMMMNYEIEIIDEVCVEGEGEVEVIEQFQEIPDVRAKKMKAEKQTEETSATEYCRVLGENEKLEIDENNEKKIFQCAFENCVSTFSRRQQCKTHFYNHLAKESQYACKYCEKRFKVASALERHERVHTNDKPFVCETCSKSFAQKEMLKRHLMIHLPKNEAPYVCKECGERFRQKDPLRQHINRIHSNAVATFNCTLCEKSFSHASGLSRHLLIHSGKVFTCEICDRKFNDKSAFKRHGIVHAKEKITKGKKKNDNKHLAEIIKKKSKKQLSIDNQE